MAYPALILLVSVLLTVPFAVWVFRRRERWRAPQRSIMLAFIAILALLCTLSGLDGYFYPYGWPGHEIPGLRASAEACSVRYGMARTRADSASVDSLFLTPIANVPGLSCGALRREHLPRCQSQSRCARLRAALHLPPG
jgi:hypothetical protein